MSKHDIELVKQIKEQMDIITALRNYTTADTSRLRGRKGHIICPFHSEKSPSFYVDTEKNTWRCFGACSTGGDVINLYAEANGVDNSEAIKQLAQDLGLITEDKQALPPEVKKEIKQKIVYRNKLKQLQSIEEDTYRKLCDVYRFMQDTQLNAKTMEELEKIAVIVDQLPYIENLLDCLLNRCGDEAYINALIKAKKITDQWRQIEGEK